jgi:MFS family permease
MTHTASSAALAESADAGPSTVLRLGLALGLVVAAQFVLQLDFSIVNVALPTIKRELDFAPADLQWIVTGYALTFGSLLLFGGRVGDLAGHRRVLLTGLGAFGVASLAARLSPTSLALILSRFVQGASAAFVAPQALAIITDLFAEGPARNRALGIFQGATAAGTARLRPDRFGAANLWPLLLGLGVSTDRRRPGGVCGGARWKQAGCGPARIHSSGPKSCTPASARASPGCSCLGAR